MTDRGSGHPTGHRGDEVQALFDRIADRYDFLNHLLSMGIDRRWRRRLASEVQASGAQRILDVCSGTGDMALEMARPERGRASVIALDFSGAMIERAHEKVRRAGLRARVLPCVGDALHLPFPEKTFGAVTITFGVRNFEDTDAGLVEALRVLKPGGLLGVLEFLRAEGAGPLAGLGAAYRRYVLPRIAAAAGGDPQAYRYLPSTIDGFDSPGEVTRRLERLGYAGVEVRPLTLSIASLILAHAPSTA